MLAFLLRNRSVILTGAVIAVVAGLLAMPRLPSGIYPEVEFPRISVVVRLGGDPPEILQSVAVRPVEESLATVLGVRRIRSRIIRGAAEVSLLFAPGTDMWQALSMVNARLADVRASLPPETELEAERLTPAEFPVVAFNLVGGGGGAERREAAERIIRPAVARAAGAARVQVLGGDAREVEVIALPSRLVALKLRPSALAAKLSEQLVRSSVGRSDAVRQSSPVVVESLADGARAVAALPAAGGAAGPVPLGEIADVLPGAADRASLVRAPEGDAVQLSVSRLPGASTPEVVTSVLDALKGIHLPAGMRLVKVYDQGDLVREAVRGIRDAILLGILLTASVLALFLRDRRAGLLAALSLPVTLAATFGAMKVTGQSLNLMSLGGLAIAIGLVIDDAIVVVEAIAARREHGAPPAQALREGLHDVAAPVIGTTLTTVVVFVPLAFLSGIVGRFFGALAVTLSAAVLISLLFALLVLPILGASALKKPAPAARAKGKRRGRLFARLRTRYSILLRGAIKRRVLAVALGLLLLAVGTLAFARVPTGFLPEFDEGSFVLDYFLPAGTSLADTDAAARKIGDILTALPDVATWSRRTGAELGPITATQFSRGDITVLLKPRRSRRPFDELLPELRGRIAAEVPAARVEFIQLIEDVLSDLSGAPRPIEIRISGDDTDELEKVAKEVESRAKTVPDLVDYYSGLEGRVPTLQITPDRDRLFRMGVAPKELAEDLEVGLQGRSIGRIPWLDRLIDVRFRYPDAVRFDPAEIRRIPVLAANGDAVPLASVAAVEEPPRQSVLFRENLRPVVLATADVESGDLGKAARELREKLKDVAPPRQGEIVIGGRAASAHDTFVELSGVFLLGLLAVFAVLVAQFRALLPSFLILATIPPALAGAAVLLFALKVPLNASSLIGLVLLTGLVVKNGILLVERAQRNVKDGLPPRLASFAAARRRMRPIVMTTLCTIFGLLPLAFGFGAAGEMQRPLAIAVTGGLLVSTAATLLVLPAFAAGRAIAPPKEEIL